MTEASFHGDVVVAGVSTPRPEASSNGDVVVAGVSPPRPEASANGDIIAAGVTLCGVGNNSFTSVPNGAAGRSVTWNT